jgi:hypothetical protein
MKWKRLDAIPANVSTHMKTTRFTPVSSTSNDEDVARKEENLLFIFGALSLLIPLVGWIVGPALILTGTWRMGKRHLEKRSVAATKNAAAQRNLQRGPCPCCGHTTTLHAPAPRVRFQCPRCHTRLIFDTGLVSEE